MKTQPLSHLSLGAYLRALAGAVDKHTAASLIERADRLDAFIGRVERAYKYLDSPTNTPSEDAARDVLADALQAIRGMPCATQPQ